MGDRLHQLVMLWIRDPETFGRYLRALGPIVARYGGTGDVAFTPTAIWAEGLDKPDVVNLVHYASAESYARFSADPDFLAIRHLRDESTDLLSFEGYLRAAEPATDPKGRVYRIELATYTGRSAAAYQRYSDEGESKMREYGYRVEYVLDVHSGSEGVPRPDVIRISSFPSVEATSQFEADPMHRLLKEELYPAAVDHVIWIEASAVSLAQEASGTTNA